MLRKLGSISFVMEFLEYNQIINYFRNSKHVELHCASSIAFRHDCTGAILGGFP